MRNRVPGSFSSTGSERRPMDCGRSSPREIKETEGLGGDSPQSQNTLPSVITSLALVPLTSSGTNAFPRGGL